MKTAVHKWYITGLTSVMMHRLDPADLEKSSKPKAAGSNDQKKEAIAEKAAHRMKNGQLGLPAEGFLRGLIVASTGMKVGKYSAKTVFKGAIMTTDDPLVGLIDPKTNAPILTYDIDTRAANNQQRGKILVHRPVIHTWSCILPLEIDEDFIPEPVLLDPIFKRAGIISGIGSFRPQNGGKFGKYDAKLIVEKKK